jgi:hypothetical protein
MNGKTSHYLKLRGVVEVRMSGLLIGYTSCNFGQKYLLFVQVFLLVMGTFPNKMQSRITCKLPQSWILYML